MVLLRKELPPEIWLMILERMPLDASVRDWAAVSRVSRGWRQHAGTALTEWIQSHELGAQFGYFAGSAAEVSFVRRHVEGTDYAAVALYWAN